MNGANHLAELDARPLLPSPVELKKICTTLDDAAKTGALPPMTLDARLAAREAASHKWLLDHSFAEEAELSAVRLAAFETAATEQTAAARQEAFEDEAEIAAEVERVREQVRADHLRETKRREQEAAAASAAKPSSGPAPLRAMPTGGRAVPTGAGAARSSSPRSSSPARPRSSPPVGGGAKRMSK